jgi:hypothetical protein
LFTLPFCVDMAGADSEPTRPGSDVLASTSAARRPAPEYVHAVPLCLVSQPCSRTRARQRAAASEMWPLATARRLADRSAAWRAGIHHPTCKNGGGRSRQPQPCLIGRSSPAKRASIRRGLKGTPPRWLLATLNCRALDSLILERPLGLYSVVS